MKNNMHEILYDWSPSTMLEVTLPDPDAFLKICETLTRIGIASRKDNTLYQSCHLLHKQGRYLITHFKEMFSLDGKQTTLTLDDVARRNTIAFLLEDWDLLQIVNPEKHPERNDMGSIKVLAYKEKSDWKLVPKYSIGGTRQ